MNKMRLKRVLSMVLTSVLVVQMGSISKSPVKAESSRRSTSMNFDFEEDLNGWESNGDVQVKEGGNLGKKYISLAPGASITKTIEDIEQGSYTLSGWFMGAHGDNTENVTVSDTGGPDSVLLLDTYLKENEWTKAGHRNVLIYNGQLTITITAGNQTLAVDDLDLVLDSADKNPILNWNFENATDKWSTKGNVTVDTDAADTKDASVRLSSDSEISQKVTVQPNTRYAVTMRAKVEKADTFETENVYYDGSTTVKRGELVHRTALGDRINLGVRGADGVVLRQAPAGTEDYSLISVVFTTGDACNSVEIYANTIYDQAYKDSITIYKTKGTELADNWNGNGKDFAWVDNFDLFEIQDDNYLRGADVSFLPVIEDNDGKYFANGVQQDCLRILSNHGVNSITTMSFVKAGNPVHDPSSLAVLSNDWYYTADGSDNITRMVEGGYFDKTHALELGKRATELNMSYLPSFHYSDYWMSNAKAYTPEEWLNVDYEGKLSNSDLEHMVSIVYNYVYDFMKNLADNKVNLAGVKLGNEQNGGIIWPIGKGATSTGHAALIKASYDAVEDAIPGISGYVHSNNGYTTSGFSSFFQSLLNNGAKMDGTAFSLYGGRSTANIILMEQTMLQDETLKYMDYVNVETAFTFTGYMAVDAQQNSSMGQSAYYKMKSPNGQYNWLLDYMQAAHDVVNPYGQTRGFYYWETDWIPTPGAGSSQGGTADVCARTMFNNGDTTIKEMGSSATGKAGDMMDSMYAYLMRGCAKNKDTAMQTPLKDAGDYSVEVTEPTGITLSTTTLTVTEGEKKRLQPSISPVDKVVSDSTIRYSSLNPEIASVTHDGYVCGRKAGTTTITASVKGNYSASVQVTVNPAKEGERITVTMNGSTITDGSTKEATVNDKVQLHAAYTGNVTEDVVVYTSSNPEVASFFGETWQTPSGEMRQQTATDSKVQLQVKKTGSTTITVRSVKGTVSTSFILNATKKAAESITLNQSEISISNNRTAKLTASLFPEDTTKYLIHWSSSDEAIAKVDADGVVTGVGIGDAVIKATSDDNKEISAICKIHVLQVQAEKISLDKENMVLQTGSERSLNALVSPDDAYDKSVTWSSSDETIAAVDNAGKVTAKAVGTAVITATTKNGGLTATCNVKVQKEAIAVTGLKLSDTEYYFRSDYFSKTNPSEAAPVYRLTPNLEPEMATNTDITWTSDTPEVATVDKFGRVTAVSEGVATVTATTVDGGYTASVLVYVPSVSEDYDNLETGSAYTLSKSSAGGGTMSGAIADTEDQNVLSITGSGSGGRGSRLELPNSITNSKIIADFDWNVGEASNSNGSYLTLTDSEGQRYLSIQTNNNTELVYSTGGTMGSNVALTDTTAVGSGFNVNNTWYHIHVMIDSIAKTTTFTITSNNDKKLTATHTLAFPEETSFASNLKSIQFYATRKSGTMKWTTQLDNLNVYAATPVAKSIALNHNSVKLIPIEGTLGASCQLEASISPKTADSQVIWSSSDESIVTVSKSGLVTPVHLYQTLDDIVLGKCTVKATAESNPSIYKEITVTISNTINASEFFSVQDETGKSVYESGNSSKVALDVGDKKQFTPVITGGDGAADIATICWKSKNKDVVTINETNGELVAMGPGSTTVELTVTMYAGEPLTASIPILVTGEALVNTTELETAIDHAKKAKEQPDYYYKETTLESYHLAISKAEEDLELAVNEKWPDSKQSIIDADIVALTTAVSKLERKDTIGITAISISGGDTPLPMGRNAELKVKVEPQLATEELVWSTSNSSVAVINSKTGRIIPVAEGTATITATSKSGAVSASKEITVTSDLSSYYKANGITITGTNEKRPATNAFDNAQTMNLHGGDNGASAYTTGSETTVGDIMVDLGETAKIDTVKTAFWSLLKYTIDISKDGTTWTTVIDHSKEATGALSTASEAFVDTFPKDTESRYVRLNIVENGGSGWIGVTVMQINGSFLSSDKVMTAYSCDPVTAGIGTFSSDSLPTKVSAVMSDKTTLEAKVHWSEEDIEKVVKANAIGEYTILGTITMEDISYSIYGNVSITDNDFKNATVTMDDTTSYCYDGKAKEPNVSVMLGQKLLYKDKDYTISYKNNINAGVASISITGQGSYTGTIEKTFKIAPASLEHAKITLEKTAYSYDGKEKKPNITSVILNEKALTAVDYDVEYRNCIVPGTAEVLITGKGNYIGTAECKFPIMKTAITTIKLAIASYIYDGKAKTPSVQILAGGKTIGIENYQVSYSNNLNAGTATVTVKAIGNFYTGTLTQSFTIKKASKTIKVKSDAIKKTSGDIPFYIGATVTAKEALSYATSNKGVATVNSKGKVTIKSCGTVIITVMSKESKNYTAAAKKVKITILPKKGELTKLKTSKKKELVVTWKKDKMVSGYEITYSTNKKFKGAKNCTVKNNKVTTITISKLSTKKTYYIRVRSYKIVKGKKLYGSYSKVKTIVINK